MQDKKTIVDQFIERCKTHKFLAYILIIGIVVGALAGFTDSVQKLLGIFNVKKYTNIDFRKEIDIPGSWTISSGDLEMSGTDLKISLTSFIKINPDKTKILLNIEMRCRETKPDWTELVGNSSSVLYEAPKYSQISDLNVTGNKGVSLVAQGYRSDTGNKAFFETTGTYWEKLFFQLPDSKNLQQKDLKEIKLHGIINAKIQLLKGR